MNYYISTTEYNCRIDLYSHQMYVCVMDKQGKKLVHKNIRNNDFNHFLKIIADYRHDMTVVCESTFNWYWLADARKEERQELGLVGRAYKCFQLN